MKIALLVWKFPVLSETFILNQITGLIDRGHEVHIHAFNLPPRHDRVHPVVEQYQLLGQTYYPFLSKHHRWRRLLKGLGWIMAKPEQWFLNRALNKGALASLPLLNGSKSQQQSAYSLELFYRTLPLLGSSYDLIHCQFGTLGPIGLLFRKLGILRGKLVTTFRGADISRHVQQHQHQVYAKLFKEGDFFLTNCEFFKLRLVELGCPEQKLVVHGSGIDCRKFVFTPRYLPSDGIVQIVSTGRLVEKKGLEYSIRASAKLRQRHPNIQYTIIGDGPLKPDLQQLIEELALSQQVSLLGWRKQEEVIKILDRSQILVAPSVTAADGNQDAPVNTLKEAMAMGLPVIGTLHGGIPELIEDGVSGFLVPERNPEAIAEKLSYLIEHPEIWVPMGQAGRAYVEKHYDMHKLNDELVDIYQQLLY